MKLNLSLLFVVTSIVNIIPVTASALTFEDLAEALNSRRACPVEGISEDRE